MSIGNTDDDVQALCLKGPGDLYVGGQFSTAGVVTTKGIARVQMSGTCTYDVSPYAFMTTEDEESDSVQIIAGPACSWTVTQNVSWITLTSTNSGAGNSYVYYDIAANPLPSSRTGTITIVGKGITHWIVQEGTGCSTSEYAEAESYFRAGMVDLYIFNNLTNAFWKFLFADCDSHYAARIMVCTLYPKFIEQWSPSIKKLVADMGMGGMNLPPTFPSSAPLLSQAMLTLKTNYFEGLAYCTNILLAIPTNWPGTNVVLSSGGITIEKRIDMGDVRALLGIQQLSLGMMKAGEAYNLQATPAGQKSAVLMTNWTPLLNANSSFLLITNRTALNLASNLVEQAKTNLVMARNLFQQRPAGSGSKYLVQTTSTNMYVPGVITNLPGLGTNGLNAIAQGQPVPVGSTILQPLVLFSNPPNRTNVPPASSTYGGSAPALVGGSGTLAFPTNGTRATAPASLLIAMSYATEIDSSVTNVEYFVNGTRQGNTARHPFSFTVNNLASGSYTVKARTWRAGLGSTDSAEVSVSVGGTTPVNQTLYDHGNPSADEQYLLELINNARENPAAEGQRLGGTTDADVKNDYQFFGVSTSQLKTVFATYPARPPLAFNKALSAAAKRHSLDMAKYDFQGHTGTDGSTVSNRIYAAGYAGNNWAECVFAYAKGPFHCHAALVVDWGVADLSHRRILMSYDAAHTVYREIGISQVFTNYGGSSHVGPRVITYDLGLIHGRSFLVGVVYRDNNGNQLYDPGEGISGVTVQPDRGAYYGQTSSSGGYAIPLTVSNGTLVVTASGGTLTSSMVQSITLDGQNKRINFRAPGQATTRIIRLAGALSFGNVTVGQSSTKTLTIYNDGNASLNVSSISYPSGFSGAFSGAIAAGGSQSVNVRFAPSSAVNYGGTITVNSDATSGGNTIACSGAGVATVLNPPNLVPYKPADWSDALVVRWNSISGLNSPVIHDKDVLRVDLAAQNIGKGSVTSAFQVALYLDNVLLQVWNGPIPIPPPYYFSATNYLLGARSAGTHTLKLVLDYLGQVAESNEGDNQYIRTFTVHPFASALPPVFGGDYEGYDGADLAVFNPPNGAWYIRDLPGNILAWNRQWGWPTAKPVLGDYNGDGAFDLTVFDTAGGKWYSKSLANQLIAWASQWGWATAKPVPGDYNGDAIWDQSVFDTAGGKWYIRNLNGSTIAWASQWGWSTAKPIPGDYNGDGKWDQAVFDTNGGKWYIRTLTSQSLAWATQWGWPSAKTVPGDYNGDGVWDLAMFDTAGGKWYIRTLGGLTLAWATQWGWPTAKPVPGDFDGDGVFDLALYDTATGKWYIKSLDGRTLGWAIGFGWRGAVVPALGD